MTRQNLVAHNKRTVFANNAVGIGGITKFDNQFIFSHQTLRIKVGQSSVQCSRRMNQLGYIALVIVFATDKYRKTGW